MSISVEVHSDKRGLVGFSFEFLSVVDWKCYCHYLEALTASLNAVKAVNFGFNEPSCFSNGEIFPKPGIDTVLPAITSVAIKSKKSSKNSLVAFLLEFANASISCNLSTNPSLLIVCASSKLVIHVFD